MKTSRPLPVQFLQNSAWYFIAIISLAGLAFFLPVLWWLPWFVSVGWGISLLIFQFFGESRTEATDQKLRIYLDRALTYRQQINNAIRTIENKSDRARVGTLTTQINTWVEAIQELVERIVSLQQNPLIQRDRLEVPLSIENLSMRLARETNTTLRSQLEQALNNSKKQLATLEELQNIIKRAEIQIESTLSLLGTIYSQILTSQSTHHVADYSRLSAEVEEQTRLLEDHLEALREVKLGERSGL